MEASWHCLTTGNKMGAIVVISGRLEMVPDGLELEC
jgi:hypothetical protein